MDMMNQIMEENGWLQVEALEDESSTRSKSLATIICIRRLFQLQLWRQHFQRRSINITPSESRFTSKLRIISVILLERQKK
jgi:hypothetical protein